MLKLDLEKPEEPETKLPTSSGSSKKQESSKKISTSASLTMLKPLCGSQQTAESSQRERNDVPELMLPENGRAGIPEC